MKKYNRVMLGRGGQFASMCRKEGFIGADFGIMMDLSESLYENWRDFNKKYVPRDAPKCTYDSYKKS